MQNKHPSLNQQISIFLLCRKDHTFEENKKILFFKYKENNYPLKIAEIELSNEKEELFLPSFISKEITGLTHYSNFSLANNPFSKWKETI